MTHPDLDRFEQLYRLADRLVAEASKAELAEAARILALNLARYQAKYGEPPAGEYLSLASVDSLTPELVRTLADGVWRAAFGATDRRIGSRAGSDYLKQPRATRPGGRTPAPRERDWS